EAAHVALDLAGQGLAQLLQPGRALALDAADPAVEIFGDAQNLAAHAFDRLGRAGFRRLDLLPDGLHRPLDAFDAVLGLGGVQPAHHLGAVGLDLAAERLGQFFEAGRLARALRFDTPLRGAQPGVQSGEGPLQPAQRLGGARLRLVEPCADLGDEFGARARPGDLLDRLHALAQLVDAGALAFLDVVKTAGEGAERRLHLAEGLERLRAGFLLELAQPA